MRVAVAIPVRDEETSIDRLIDSLLEQTRAPDEIIIADAGSRDRTVALIERRVARGEPIKLLQIGAAFPGRGRNEAVRATTCEWIAFIDGGIHADPTWLERMVGYAQEHPAMEVVYGNFEPVTPSFFTRCAALAYVPVRQRSTGTSGWRGVCIASSLVRRTVWERTCGFPEHLRSAEDLLFIEAVEREVGGRVGIVPDAIVHWEIAADISRTLARFCTYARYDLVAGRYARWHRAIVSRYLAIGILACGTGPAAPLTFSALTMAMLGARSIRSMRQKPEFLEPHLKGKSLQLVTTAGILGLLDYAAFHGLATWLWQDVVRNPR